MTQRDYFPIMLNIIIASSLVISSYCHTNYTSLPLVPLAYKRLLRCVQSRLSSNAIRYVYPYEDVEDHYQFILKETMRYRQIPFHEWSDYKGPWIENHFISNFIDKPLSYFNGLIPLFIQWVDIQVNEFTTKNDSIPRYRSLMTHMQKILRSNVLYVTVSQADGGLTYRKKILRNVLILSAGGYGHIPIPLIKGELNYVPLPATFENDVGFFGKARGRRGRDSLMMKTAAVLSVAGKGLKYEINRTELWRDRISNTKFNLAPRGVGRQSYRTAEIIQIGRIPVYMYTDAPWVPYAGSKVDLYSIGVVLNLNNVREFIEKLSGLTVLDLNYIFKRIEYARAYYTYAGVIHQMELFFQDPLGKNGGYLRCNKVPRTIM